MEQVWYAFPRRSVGTRLNNYKERGNEIKSVLVSSFPRSCVGMHICVMNILLPAVLKKFHLIPTLRVGMHTR